MDIILKWKFKSFANAPFVFRHTRRSGSNRGMGLLTPEMMQKLRENRRVGGGNGEENLKKYDLFPVAKLVTPDGKRAWLLSDVDPEDEDVFLALVDYGEDNDWEGPITEYIDLPKLQAYHANIGLPVQLDLNFMPNKTLWEYYEAAQAAGRIVT